MARPKKQEHEKRSSRLGPFDVTAAERAYAQDQAEVAGLTLSEYGRRRILSAKVPARPASIDAGMLVELNRIGVNLNQIARALNRGRDSDPQQIGHVLALLNTTLETMARRYGS